MAWSPFIYGTALFGSTRLVPAFMQLALHLPRQAGTVHGRPDTLISQCASTVNFLRQPGGAVGMSLAGIVRSLPRIPRA